MVSFWSNEAKALKKQSSSKKKTKAVLARPWERFLAFLGDLAFAHLLSFLLLSFPSFARFEKAIIQNLSGLAKALKVEPEFLGFLFLWFVVTIFFRFLHTLFFGVSLFEMLAGFRSSGPWWWRRVGGASRHLVDLILGPLLVFDLPLLRGKASLKEDLSGSKLLMTRKSGAWKLYLFLPLVLLFSISGPLFKNLALADGLVVSFETVDKKELKKSDNFNSFQDFNSEKFNFKVFSSLENGRFSLFPDFEFIKIKTKKRLSPYLLIFDHQNKTSGHLKVGHRLQLLELLRIGARGNPLFAKTFPALSEALREDHAKFAEKAYDPKVGNQLLFNPLIKEDIIKLVKASFELGMGNIVGHVLHYGPFLRGFIELRSAFLYLVPKGVKPEVDLITLGSGDFLRFRQTLGKEYPVARPVIETFIPLESHNAFSLQMAWDNSLPSALSANSFRETFLANAEWFFDYKDFFKKPHLEAQVTPVYALDLLSEKDKSQESREILEEFLYRYYYQKCRKAIKSGDRELLESLRFNIMRLSSIMQVKSKESLFSALFINQWKELWNSFQARDRNYFNI